MKNLVILGAGTGGTIVANRLRHRLPADWQLTVIDPDALHLYQPGLLFIPFGAHSEVALLRPRQGTLRAGVRWVRREVLRIDTASRRVALQGAESVPYDLLVIANGSRIRPDMLNGLTDPGWGEQAHDFYTLEGAMALRESLARFEEGRLVVNVVEMPIKCPVAPLEFVFLADAFLRENNRRHRVELVYVTPLDAVFTRPLAAARLGKLLEAKDIRVETDFSTGEVDGERRVLRSYDEREIHYDLLVTIPTHTGAAFVEESGLGNELAFIPTERSLLQVLGQDRIFALGDATDLPSSKAGSVAHFQAEVLAHNLLDLIAGKSPSQTFDGHANCFVESGFGKALLIDFNYDVDPMPGHYPFPGVGPFTLLGESRRNHLGKLAFSWVYWNLLLPGRPMPVPNHMSLRGKKLLGGSTAAPAHP